MRIFARCYMQSDFEKRRCFGKGNNTKCAELTHPRRARSATPLNMSYSRVFPSRLGHMYTRSFCKSSLCVHTITLNSYITYVKTQLTAGKNICFYANSMKVFEIRNFMPGLLQKTTICENMHKHTWARPTHGVLSLHPARGAAP